MGGDGCGVSGGDDDGDGDGNGDGGDGDGNGDGGDGGGGGGSGGGDGGWGGNREDGGSGSNTLWPLREAPAYPGTAAATVAVESSSPPEAVPPQPISSGIPK